MRALAQTPDGWLWIGAASGLFRFDGVGFEPKPGLGPDTEDGSVTALFADRSGALWIGYGSGRIGLLRNGRQSNVTPPDHHRWATQFVQEPGGAVWLRSSGRGVRLARYEGGRWTVFANTDGVPPNLQSIGTQADGAVWIASTRHPPQRLQAGATRFEATGLTLKGNVTLQPDRHGTLWGIAASGVARRLAGFTEAVPEPPELAGQRVGLFDRDDNLWVGTRSAGLLRLPTAPPRPGVDDNPQPPGDQRFTAADGLTSNTVSALLEDAEGNLWVGTPAGLDRFRAADVMLEQRIPPQSRFGYVLMADRQGTVHVVDSDHAFRIRPGQAPEQLPGQFDNPEALCESPDGTVWLATHGGIFRLEGDRYTPAPAPPARADYLDCVADARGDVWFVRVSGGFLVWRAGAWIAVPAAGQKPDEVVNAVLPDRQEGLLVSLRGRGLVHVDTQSARPVWPVARMPIANVDVMWRGARGDLWGGRAGIARWRDGTLRSRVDAQLAGLTGIVQTPDGPNADTWLLGRAGIGRVPTAALERALDDPGAPLPVRWFDHRDGLGGPPTFAYVKNSAARGGDGRLWFVTTEGIVKIDPARLLRQAHPPNVVITSLVADGQRHRDPQALVLGPGGARLEIGCAALSLTAPERVRFRYRLEGVDAQWVEAGGQRRAVYTQLAPGTYRFTVATAHHDGEWNERGASVSFEVPPTFVQSTGFRLLCGAALALLLWGAYALRIRQVTARVRLDASLRAAERERIARDLHDTLLQSFQGLMLRLQAVADGLPADSQARQRLEQSLERGDDALVEGRDRVQQLRAAVPQVDLATALEASAHEDGEPPVATQVTVQGRPRPLLPSAQDEALLIGREAVRNAYAHARACRVDVQIAYLPQGLRLSVTDNGTGLPPAAAEAGAPTGPARPRFGLLGMHERAKRLGGVLQVGPGDGAGTRVALWIPARVAYGRQARPGWQFWRRAGEATPSDGAAPPPSGR